MPFVNHSTGISLRKWYGIDATLHKVIVKRSVSSHFMTVPPAVYPSGTVMLAYLDDPERPDMADLELPNGDLIRVMKSECEKV